MHKMLKCTMSNPYTLMIALADSQIWKAINIILSLNEIIQILLVAQIIQIPYTYIRSCLGKSHDVIYLNCLIYPRQHPIPSES